MADIVPFTATHILLVEDSASDFAIIRAWLQDTGDHQYTVSHAHTLADAIGLLEEQTFHAALLDLSLPDTSGLEGLTRLQNRMPTMPVVILTGSDDETLAMKAVENGAQDYLVKDKADGATLQRAVRYAIQRKLFEDGIIRQANFDNLTSLANRMLFENRLEMALARIKRSKQGVGVLFLDLNDFKHVNDTLGHAAGDMLLKEIGNRMVQCMRPYDTVARLGGDEFAVLVDGITQPRDCAAVAEKCIHAISRPVLMDMRQFIVGVSIGIATCSAEQDLSAAFLLSQADIAMYRAKEDAGNTYRFYTSDMDEALTVRRQMETELAMAVHNNELSLCYQPKQALESGEISGVEALVRWNHPKRGTLLPAAFLDIAREIRLLEEIETWVLGQVCRDMQRWREMHLPVIQVAVNISSGLFDTPHFAVTLMSLIAQHGIMPGQLALELPEAVFVPADLQRAKTFAQLYKLGIMITMDKFGGHMSSLQSLKGIALSEIKFDTQFSQSAEGPLEDVRLVKAIIACAHALGIRVVASGIESDELRTRLKEQRCDAIQGFIYSRPMPAAYLEEWLQNAKANTNTHPAMMPAAQESRNTA